MYNRDAEGRMNGGMEGEQVKGGRREAKAEE